MDIFRLLSLLPWKFVSTVPLTILEIFHCPSSKRKRSSQLRSYDAMNDVNDEKKVISCQALARGFLVRRRMNKVRDDFLRIVSEIEGVSSSSSSSQRSVNRELKSVAKLPSKVPCADAERDSPVEKSNLDSAPILVDDSVKSVDEDTTSVAPFLDASSTAPDASSTAPGGKTLKDLPSNLEAISAVPDLEGLRSLSADNVTAAAFEESMCDLDAAQLEEIKVRTAFELIWVHNLIQTRKNYLRV